MTHQTRFFKLHDTFGNFLVQALESFRVAFLLQAINFDPEAVNPITSIDCHAPELGARARVP